MAVLSPSPQQKHHVGWRPYLILSMAPLCWAGNIVLARGVIDIIEPVGFAFWRWTLAFALLAPFAWRHAAHDWALVVRHWRIMVFLGLTGIASFNTLLYIAVHTTTAINGALIQTTMPAVIILVSLMSFGDKVSKLQSCGVALCILGAALVVLHGRIMSLLHLSLVQGDVLMMVAVVLYALYSAFLRRRPPVHPLSFLVYTFGIGAAGLLPIYLYETAVHTETTVFTMAAAASVLYVAVFPSIIAYFCWNHGVAALGANRAGLFINLIPVFATLMAVIWLGESLKAYHLTGMALIASGMLLFNRR